MGLRLKRIAFIYLFSYLAVAAIGFGLAPTLTLKLFLSNGDYGEILPRLLGAMMGVLSFLLFMIYRQGDWPKYSPFTMMARTPLVLFIFYLFYVSRDPMFLIINAIVLVGLVTTAIGTALHNNP
ncbi:MAG: hypothetical protein OEN21_12805 [Myxococcales bacterium]|nr:hypothetical protein [Myxococcales bacterium]